MRQSILYIALLLLGYRGFAQDTVKKTFIRAYDAGIFVSFTEPNRNIMSGHDYRKMLPENTLLQTYKANSGRTSNGDISDVGGSVAFVFWSEKKKRYNDRIQLRIGASYNMEVFDVHENGTYQNACDTLISNTSPKVYYIDTVKRYDYNLRRQQDAVGMFIQHTFHTRQNKYVSFYTGYGFRYYYILRHQLDVSLDYSESFIDQNGKDYYNSYESSNNYSLYEKSAVQSSNTLAVYIPIGANLRVVRPLRGTISRFSFNPELAVCYRMQEFLNYGSSDEFFFYVNFRATFNFNRIRL
ncbi:MAG: hypothetical protein K0S53_3039 [Bacteroidetes bacterium]|jgi:hypothetical protein|nr:hypothetical protein [Bacteroidota bacterium]MDF2450755.1 hypothetical protein [Bacteroidota bacterium]